MQLHELAAKLAPKDGDVVVVTFRDPIHGGGSRADPIAMLPPDYTRWGIVDRDYKHMVEVGECWVVKHHKRGGATFLIPLKKVTLDDFIKINSTTLHHLADEVAMRHPHLLEILKEAPPDPTEEVARKSKILGAMMKKRYKHLLPDDQPKQDSVAAPQQPKQENTQELWLLDTNVFIQAMQDEEVAHLLGQYEVATTQACVQEGCPMIPGVEPVVIWTGAPPKDLLMVAKANINPETRKMASVADLSLVQAAIKDDRVIGIISDDNDVHNLHPESLVQQATNRSIRVMRVNDWTRP